MHASLKSNTVLVLSQAPTLQDRLCLGPPGPQCMNSRHGVRVLVTQQPHPGVDHLLLDGDRVTGSARLPIGTRSCNPPTS